MTTFAEFRPLLQRKPPRGTDFLYCKDKENSAIRHGGNVHCFFAKGEINMNNIYKVIWSKAKNCYVVASEIARSHTKSASGSEKIGGVTRRSLLASLMALSLLCGGLGVAEASVHVDESSVTTYEVYTTGETYNRTEIDGKLALKANANDVATNKANIAKLQADVGNATSGLTQKVTEQGEKIAASEAAISTNKDSIAELRANKLDAATASTTYATRDALNETNTKVTTLENTVGDNTKGLVKDVAELRTQGITLNNALGDKANKSDLEAANAKITANEGNIAVLQTKTEKLSADGKSLTDMDKVETDALKVTGQISNGTVNTTLEAIDASMKQTVKNKTAIGELQTKTGEQQTAINGLDAKTTKITYNAALGTNVDGVTFNAGAVTGVTSINGTEIGTKESGEYIHQDNSIWGNMKKVDTQVKTNADNIETNKNAITALDTKVGTVGTGTYLDPTKSVGENLGLLDAGLKKEVGDRTAAVEAEKAAREAADTALSDRIGTVDADGNYIKKSATNNVSENLKVLDTQAKTNADAIAQETADRKAAIGQLAVNGNYIEKDKNVSDNLVNLDNQAKVNADAIVETDKRTGGITRNLEKTQTTIEGAVKVDNQGNVKDVKNLSAETITTTGNASIGGDLKVTGTITTDKMIFGDPATNNYTEIDHGKVTSKNLLVVTGTAETISSSSTFNAEENKVGFANSATGEQSFHKQTSDIIMDNVKDRENSNNRTQTKTETKDIITDKDGNSSTTSQTASENKTYLKDKDGKNTNSTVDTAKGYDKTIKGENGETSTKQDELNITNTAQNGTITNDAQNIVNNATGDMTNTVGGKLTTTVTGATEENYNGGLTTKVTGEEKHTVTGKQTNTVEGGQENIISGGQTNTITGGQINNITGDQTTNVTDGNISNTAKNITNAATETLTDKVGDNTRVTTSTSITDTVGTANRKIENDKITDTAGDSTVTTENRKGTTFAKTGSTEFSTEAGAPTDTNIAGNHITTGRVDANELGVSDKDGANTADLSVKAGEGVKASAGDGKTKGSLDVKADEVGSSVTDGTGKGSTFKQRIDAIMGNVKTDAGESEVTQKGDEITSKVGIGEATNSSVTQKKDSLQAAVTDGTNTNVSYDTANASAKLLTDGTKMNKQQDNLNSSEKTITNGIYTTSTVQSALDITATAKDGTITHDAKNIVNNASEKITNTAKTMDTTVTGKATESYGELETTVKGKETHTVTGDQVNTIGGNQTTTVTGDISNKAENITNEANTKLTDKVGTNTRVLDNDGITDTVGGSTFKQRIDKIMMESKEVSIKADEKLTNEAKVITNKASEVINNEAIDINNTATGIINSKASEIKNQADKLISNKVGENTSEYMEDGKITTSIKDGTKSTVTIQNADGLQTGVTNGTSTNASATTATSSAQTIASGNKANSVITTIDGTQFVNSEAATPVTGASGAGNAVNTTIKGNTITTGKVTMDYADVMKDLGVRGNANINGKTTTGSLEVTGTSTLKGDVTMENNATVGNNLTVNGTTKTKTLSVTENATVGGTLGVTGKATFKDSVDIARDLTVGGNATIAGDVTAKSYKVGDKTYISADGINANDQKITNVADGSISEGSKDAVNGGQLYGVKRDLEHQVDKVGANAAAMANLRPMEFDPSSKWNIAAAIGNYGSETAAALGAFYRPNDDVMVNLSTAFGTGENMVGGGVSVRLGKGSNKLSREESNALKDQVDDLTARMDALLSVLNPNMSKDFPDVPENHWAYEAVSRLAGNDIVQGYPDGEFHGDRTMTRYEMAEIIYNALSRGAEAEKELVEEFKPELQAMAASEKATAERAEG